MKNQRMLLVAVGVSLSSLIFGFDTKGSGTGDDVVPVVRCRLFELVDEGGKVRAQFKVEPEGDVVFRLRDKTGTIRVKMGASTNGSGFVLLNDSTEVGVQILANETGTLVKMVDKKGKQKVMAP